MTRRDGWIIAALMFAVAGGVALGYGWAQRNTDAPSAPAAPSGKDERVLYWYDPMFPDRHFDAPGPSPFMDMPLQPKYADSEGADNGVRIDAGLIHNTGVRLAEVVRGTLAMDITALGSVQYDTRLAAQVQARATGIVEAVHDRAVGEWVPEGAPLLDVRVPEWYAAQAEYVALQRAGDALLTASARRRLQQMGISETVLADLDRGEPPRAVITLTAPRAGVLTDFAARLGMTVAMGQTVAVINGVEHVWLESAVPEAQAAPVIVGTPIAAIFAAWPQQERTGRVTELLPSLDAATRTVRVRAEIANPARELRPGMTAQVRIAGTARRDTLLVPSAAVIATGRRNVVIVALAGGRYRPAEVTVGRERGEQSEILAGLNVGEQVVVSGQFLIDSEASLQGVLARLAAPAAHSSRGRVEDITSTSITLAHEPVPALQWGAMTMTFQLADPALAQGLARGEAVEFEFRQEADGGVTVTRVEKSR